MSEPDPPPIEPGRGRLIYDKKRRTIVHSIPMDVNSPESALWSENMRLKSENEALQERLADQQAQWGYTESIQTLQIERLTAALEKVRSYNVSIAAGEINYRPHDHIQVIDAALSSQKRAD